MSLHSLRYSQSTQILTVPNRNIGPILQSSRLQCHRDDDSSRQQAIGESHMLGGSDSLASPKPYIRTRGDLTHKINNSTQQHSYNHTKLRLFACQQRSTNLGIGLRRIQHPPSIRTNLFQEASTPVGHVLQHLVNQLGFNGGSTVGPNETKVGTHCPDEKWEHPVPVKHRSV